MSSVDLYRIPYTLAASVVRQLCSVRGVSNEEYVKIVNLGGAGSAWVGETTSPLETTTPTLAELKPYYGQLQASPTATQKSLDDMFFDVEAWLAEEVSIAFAEAENTAFTTGNGVLKPKGVAVVFESIHLCMMMRGVSQQNSFTITSSLRGEFKSDSKTRAEFMNLLGHQRQSFA